MSRLVLWGGTVPPDLDLERLRANLRGAPLLIVVGGQDPFVAADQVRSEEARLRGVGLEVTLRQFPGGHGVDRAVLAELA